MLRVMRNLLRVGAACAVAVAVLVTGFPAVAQGIGIDIYQRAPMAEAAMRGDTARLRGLLLSGQSPNGVDLEGRPAILLAAWGNHIGVVEALVEAKVRVDQRDKIGSTAMIAAAERGFDRVVELLIEGKGNVNLENRQGMTPLIAAAQKGYSQVVERLIKAGANLDQQDHSGRTAMEWAQLNNRRQVVDLLRRAGAKS
jgi:uncharacterized protein